VPKEREVLGYRVRFTRRRYGRQTYCWAECCVDGEWHELGDPWPAVNWPRQDLEDAVCYLESMLGIEQPGHRNGQHIGMFI